MKIFVLVILCILLLPASITRAYYENESTITESTTFIVGVESPKILEIPLRYGEKVSGVVSSVPLGVTFVVTDQGNNNLVLLKDTKNSGFSLVANIAGIHLFRFMLDQQELVFNRIVTLEITHQGGGLLPYNAGVYLPLRPKGGKGYPMMLPSHVGIKVVLTVLGGDKRVTLESSTPGGIILPSVEIESSYSMSFLTIKTGEYNLHIQNTSVHDCKLVRIEPFTDVGGSWRAWEW